MIGWPRDASQCQVACRFGELSQQPTWPHDMHILRCTHWPPILRQSSQPSLEGVTSAIASKRPQAYGMAAIPSLGRVPRAGPASPFCAVVASPGVPWSEPGTPVGPSERWTSRLGGSGGPHLDLDDVGVAGAGGGIRV